ncbi:helix-turn-helix domain-containing protein [Enterovirga sp.]|uniref:helix-turn-helix domain-containing protein n=1 Tax=Enterovirga sp. TaxID=2026350 RepID=UPI002BDDE3B2|nr:helix-turn-helix domain-containing protein [Enterovirga sp.]HMO28923.1 helix-turn-helix domain-containing protein [Enterovirga sp.]
MERIAAAASPPHRTFQEVLDETPYSYVLKLRLHRIRHVLVSDAELSCTIASIANLWGITELGRFAGHYQELFGELPSETRMRCRRLLQSTDTYT